MTDLVSIGFQSPSELRILQPYPLFSLDAMMHVKYLGSISVYGPN
jgi:hypothetical protein